MSTVIDRQVSAFGNSVTDAHNEAMAFWAVQDIASAGPGVAHAVLQIIAFHRSKTPLTREQVDAYSLACRKLLEEMTRGRRMVREMKYRGHNVRGEEEFAEAMLEVRKTLVSLREIFEPPFQPTAGAQTLPADQQSLPNRPPQKWFEEDVRGLRGMDCVRSD